MVSHDTTVIRHLGCRATLVSHDTSTVVGENPLKKLRDARGRWITLKVKASFTPGRQFRVSESSFSDIPNLNMRGTFSPSSRIGIKQPTGVWHGPTPAPCHSPIGWLMPRREDGEKVHCVRRVSNDSRPVTVDRCRSSANGRESLVGPG